MDRLNKIERLKDELRETDYIPIKASEGHDVSEHGDYISYRQGLRDLINLLDIMTDEEFYEQYPDELQPIEDLEEYIEDFEEYIN